MALKPFSGTLDDAPPLKPFAGELDPPTQATPATAAIERPSSTIRRVVGDTAVDLGKGLLGVGEAVVGAGNIVSGGYVGKGLEAIGYDPQTSKKMLEEGYTPERVAANKEVADAKGFMPTIAAAIKNPSTIAGAVVESAPLMLGGAGLARGGATLLGKAGSIARPGLMGQLAAIPQTVAGRIGLAAAGEGLVGAGSAAESIRQQSDDGLLDAKGTVASLASGAGTAILGALGGKAAQKLGIADVDVALAGGSTLAGPKKNILRRAAQGMLAEGVFEELPQSAQETMWQNYATGKPIMDGVAEASAMGALAGGVMGGGFSAIAGNPKEQPAPTGQPDPTTQVNPAAEPSAVQAAPVAQPATPDPFDGEVMNAELDAAMRTENGTPTDPPSTANLSEPATNRVQQAAANMRMEAQVMDAQAQTGIGKVAAMATAMQADAIEQEAPLDRLARVATAAGFDPAEVLKANQAYDPDGETFADLPDEVLSGYAKTLLEDAARERSAPEQRDVDSVGLRGNDVPAARDGEAPLGSLPVEVDGGAASLAGQVPIQGDAAGAQAQGVTRENPLPESEIDRAPVGAWVSGPSIPGVDKADTVRQVTDVPIDQIDATEFTSDGKLVADKQADASRYAEAMRNGDQFPNARGSVLPNGKIKLQDGHRRLAAAIENGATTLRVAVNPLPATAGQAPQAAEATQQAPALSPQGDPPAIPQTSGALQEPPATAGTASQEVGQSPNTSLQQSGTPSPQGTPVEGGGQPSGAVDPDSPQGRAAARDAGVPASLIAARDAATVRSQAASAAMQAFPAGPMGLTPDAVKATPEWKAARIEMDRAATALRNANAAVNVARKTAAAKAKNRPVTSKELKAAEAEKAKAKEAPATGVDEAAVRAAYNAAMQTKTGVKDFDYGKGAFGDMIVGALNRDPAVVEYARNTLTNGNNETGLKVFFQQAGIKMPKTQREQKAAFDAYIGVSPETRAASDADNAKAQADKREQKVASIRARQPVPDFADYAEAVRWLNNRSEAFPNKGAYKATPEFAEWYEKAKPLYAPYKEGFTNKRAAALAEAGIKAGDRVQTSQIGMFMTGGTWTGTVTMRGGEPWVRVDGDGIPASKNGKVKQAKLLRWDARWKKVEAAATTPAETKRRAPAEEAKAEGIVATQGPADAKGERKFYVTIIRDSKVARLAGPFDTKAEADGMVDRASSLARELDPRAAFDGFGVSAVTSENHKPGKLNEQLGLSAAPVEAAQPEKKAARAPESSAAEPTATGQTWEESLVESLRIIADRVDAEGPRSRRPDPNWMKQAMKWRVAKDPGAWVLADSGRVTGALASAKIAFSKAKTTADLRAIADKFEQATKSSAAQNADSKPAAQAASEPAAKIDDFGEKLEGARKFLPPSLKETLGDDQIASLPLSKVWPSDAHLEIEDPMTAAMAFTARNEIPPKPRTPRNVAAWVTQVKMFRALMNKFTTESMDRLLEIADEKGFASLRAEFFPRVQLLAQLPRESWGRVEKVGHYPNARRLKTEEELKRDGFVAELRAGSTTYYDYFKVDPKTGKRSDRIVPWGETSSLHDELFTPAPHSTVTIDGKTTTFDVPAIGPDEVGKVLELLGQAKPQKGGLTSRDFEVRSKYGSKAAFINRKGDAAYRKLKEFTGDDAVKQAQAYLKDNVPALAEAWEGVKARDNVGKGDIRRAANEERKGENRRNGKDVTEAMFEAAFGFRGVQFGNWVKQGKGGKDRQGLLNDAYDGLLDLSDVLGIPSRAISLEGTLGLSLGAQGTGKHAATFYPDRLVINLTKTRGSGSLAHEWFHALDNYFARKRGGEVPFTGDNTAYRENNFITYKPEPMLRSTKGFGTKTKAEVARLHKVHPKANAYYPENWEPSPDHKQGVRPVVEKAFAELVAALNASPMAKRSADIDGVKVRGDVISTDGYWSRIIERGARSFENYVISKMAQRGWSNDFLVNIRSLDQWREIGKNEDRYPYPKPEEEAPIAEAFDKLFATIEARETDTGIALESVEGLTVEEGVEPTATEAAAFDRQSIDRKALREKLSREQGEADADANGLREAVNKVVRKAGKVVYLRGVDGLPDEVRGPLDRAAAQRGAKMRTAGLYHPATGTTYLFTDVLKSPQLAAFTAAHEIAGHQGLRALLGADLNSVLDLAEQNPTVRKVAASMARQRNLRPDQRYLAIEEALADLAAANATGNWQRIQDKHGVTPSKEMQSKLRAFIANVVRQIKMLFKTRNVGFSDAQVQQLLGNAFKAAQGQSAIGQPQSALESTEGGSLDGVDLSKTKVVGKDGKPLTVFHGTASAIEGDYRIPAFFSESRDGAEWFTQGEDDGVVNEAKLDIRNPLDISTQSGSFKFVKLARKAGVKIESDIADDGKPWDFLAPEIAKHSPYDGTNVADLAYIPKVRKALEAAGYDGLKAADPLENGDHDVWVALRPDQIITQPQPLESTEDQTQTPAFKKWFGEGGIRDDDGNPQAFFHSGSVDFDRVEEGSGRFGGIFALPDKSAKYGEMDHKLFLRGPVATTDDLREFVRDLADDGASIVSDALGVNPGDAADVAIKGALDESASSAFMSAIGTRDESDAYAAMQRLRGQIAKAAGFTSVEITDEFDGDAVLIVRSGAAKSADRNNGNFSPDNPSILESVEAFTLSDNPTPADTRIPGEITLDPLHKAGVKGVLARLGKKFTDLKPAALALVPLQEMDDFTPKTVQKDGTTVSAQPAVATYIQLQNDMQAMRNTLYVDYDKTAQDLHAYSTVGAGIKGFFGKAVNQQGRDLFALMHDSTIAGVDPSEQNVRYKDPGKAAKYRDLQERYAKIPKEGQDLFKAVRDAYAAQTDLLDEVIEANATRAAEITTNRARRKLEDREREIREDGNLNPLEKAKASAAAKKAYDDTVDEGGTASKIAALRKMLESNRVPKPYFPLKRYGKYWVSVLKDGKLAGFSKFETAAEQSEFSKSMVAQGYSTRLKYEGDAAQTREMIDPKFVADVEEILTGLPDQIRDDVWQAYLERMPDMSLRKSFIHRKNVAGYHFDALKAFGSTLFHGSHQIARLKYGMEMAEAIDVAKEQANALRESNPEGALAADMVAGELDKRHAFIMNPTNAKWAQQVSGAAFLYSLGANPAHLFLNATQTVMLGVPILGTRYGFGRASKALTKAARDFAKGKGHLEKANLTTDELRAFRKLQASGIIEKSQAHDIAGIGSEGVEYDSVRKKVMDKIGWFMHQSERFNREVTAMAGYRLARAEGRSHDAAIAEASKQVYQIHFDYSNAARARVMQGDMAKALLVFRNYQANMIYRLFRDIHQSIRGESVQIKREARKQLGAIMGMYGLFAGTMGVPFYGLAMALAGAFDDEDDPVTAEQQFVNGTVEFLGPTAAKVLLRGIPGTLFDVDLTERIGMGNLWFRSPQQEMEGRDAYYYWMEQLLGAGVAPVKGVFDGINLAMQGQIQRGVERASPAALRNPMQAIRMAQEGGVTSLDGDLIKEVNGGDMLTKALGFQPLSVSEQYEANNEIKGADRRLSNRRQRLMNRYFLARQMGDDTAEAMADIQAFNLKNPEYAITRDTMQRSAKTRARNSANSEGGIVMTRRMRRLQDRLNTEETE